VTITNPEHPAHRNVPKLYNSAEVGEMLGITARQVANARQSGALKCVRISGSAVRHTMAQVEAFIAARSNDEAAD
jgi:hypothetical protein